MNFDISDAIYGLRNLSVGDEEETRIGDYTFLDFPEAIASQWQALVDAGKFEDAYWLVIEDSLRPYTPDQVEAFIGAWVEEFNREQGEAEDKEDDESITVQELIDLWKAHRAERNPGTNGLHDSEISPEAAARRKAYYQAADAAFEVADEARFLEQATLWFRELYGDDADAQLAEAIAEEGSLVAALRVAMYG